MNNKKILIENADDYSEQLQALRNGQLPPDNRNDYWSEEDTKKLVALFKAGVGLSQIALILKRTELSVTCRLQALGEFVPQCRPRAKKSKVPRCKCKKCDCEDCPRIGQDQCCNKTS